MQPIRLRRELLLLTGLLLSASGLWAQARPISGTITSEDGPLIGVSVLKQGTSSGTVTDLDGRFTLSAEPEDVLVISYIGYVTQEIPVGDQTTIDVDLAADNTTLDEVVVVGYGSQKKSDLTGAVSQVSGKELGKFPQANATDALQGRMAGVRIESAGGAPGAGALVTIRGSSTLSDNPPLFVIDGMLTSNMDFLNPADIESVSVLKDASATAIYGSRAANGVVIVTTRKGTPNGGLQIEADVATGVSAAINTIDWANASQYALIRNRANDNDGTPRSPANDTDFDPTVDTDIQEESLRSGSIHNAGVRLFGGGDNTTFNISANYLEEEGIVIASDFTKMNLRANSTFTKGRFRLEETISLARTINNPNFYFNRERDILPTVPFRDAEGNFTATNDPNGSTAAFGVGNVGNSVGRAVLEDRTVTDNIALANLAASLEFLPGLTYKISGSLDYRQTNNFRFTPTFRFNSTTVGRQDFQELAETNFNGLNTLLENTLNYSRELGGAHRLDLLAGYTYQNNTGRSLGTVARNFPSNDIRVASVAANFAQAPSFEFRDVLLSYLGRVNYVYDDRYLVTASIRRDGSSLFREDIRWGVFPSVAVGWNISNEDFWSGDGFIQDLKLRASYGQIGNNNVGSYQYQPRLNTNSEYILGGVRTGGVAGTDFINQDITWETTVTTDIGLEASLLGGALDLTADYFIKDSRDVLVNLSVPRYTGAGNNPPFNAATIRNAGFELGANYGNFTGDFNWSVGANFTILDNEVTELGVDPISAGQFTSNGLRSTRIEAGQPIGSFYGYRFDGIYQTDAEAEADGRTDAVAGDIRFRDLNGDGVLNDQDQEFLGSPVPTFTYGMNFNFFFRGFDATLLFNGVAGNQILNGNIYRGFFDTEGNYLAAAVNGWTPENPSTTLPRNTLTDQAFNRRTSDFYLESGAYFRLRNFQLGYTIPTGALGSVGGVVSKLRLYVNAQNLFTITEYTGYYPEVGQNGRGDVNLFNAGVDESAYPVPRTFLFGLQLGF